MGVVRVVDFHFWHHQLKKIYYFEFFVSETQFCMHLFVAVNSLCGG